MPQMLAMQTSVLEYDLEHPTTDWHELAPAISSEAKPLGGTSI